MEALAVGLSRRNRFGRHYHQQGREISVTRNNKMRRTSRPAPR